MTTLALAPATTEAPARLALDTTVAEHRLVIRAEMEARAASMTRKAARSAWNHEVSEYARAAVRVCPFCLESVHSVVMAQWTGRIAILRKVGARVETAVEGTMTTHIARHDGSSYKAGWAITRNLWK